VFVLTYCSDLCVRASALTHLNMLMLLLIYGIDYAGGHVCRVLLFGVVSQLIFRRYDFVFFRVHMCVRVLVAFVVEVGLCLVSVLLLTYLVIYFWWSHGHLWWEGGVGGDKVSRKLLILLFDD